MSNPIRQARRAAGLAAALLAVTASPLLAHTGAGPVHGLAHGLAHPLGGVDHLLGMWAAQRGGRATWLLPLSFVVGMVGGGLLGMGGLALPGIELGIVLSVVLLGAAVAVASRVPLAASMAVVAVLAVAHGHAHGTEMPASVSAAAYAAGFVTATAALHGAGVVVAAGLARRIPSALPLRLAGSAIGAAGALLLVRQVAG
jgi:urease accessory protein